MGSVGKVKTAGPSIYFRFKSKNVLLPTRQPNSEAEVLHEFIEPR